MKTDSNRINLLSASLATVALAASAAFADGDGGAAKPPVPSAAGRDVDLAICLDTSGSMDGLIDAARQKIWSIVNDLALAEPAPKLHVALLTYGNDGHSAELGCLARHRFVERPPVIVLAEL